MRINDVNPNALIERTAKQLQEIIKAPKWALFVKTGVHKDRPPAREDWWYVRAAAVLRTVALTGPIGVEKLRTKYGGKQNRGVKPEKFKKGSGHILRTVLQQLEQAKLVEQKTVKNHKGRLITRQGKSLLDKIAHDIHGKISTPKPKATVSKTE